MNKLFVVMFNLSDTDAIFLLDFLSIFFFFWLRWFGCSIQRTVCPLFPHFSMDSMRFDEIWLLLLLTLSLSLSLAPSHSLQRQKNDDHAKSIVPMDSHINDACISRAQQMCDDNMIFENLHVARHNIVPFDTNQQQPTTANKYTRQTPTNE